VGGLGVPKKNLSIISLGCFRNTYDSETALKRFLDTGYRFSAQENIFLTGIEDFKNCDTLVINTCGFIDKAKEESIDFIKEAIKLKQEGRVKRLLVFGCLVERYHEKLKKSFPEVDEWWGAEKFIQRFSERKKLLPAHIDFLKICEGCLNKCSYCTIPHIKGSLRSKSLGEIIKEAKFLDKKGIKELNIIGQDITSWGKDLKTKEDLSLLIKAILKNTKNIRWIRLLYTHPRNIDNKLIDLIANEERICKYIDLPIQHINNRILKAMNRNITKKETVDLINKIRKIIKGCVIRTSVITGFPTETEKEFDELLEFMKEAKFERLGAFMYSREEGSPAAKLKKQIAGDDKLARWNEIMGIQKAISLENNKKLIGREFEILIDEKDETGRNLYLGRTYMDAPEVDGSVYIKGHEIKVGEFTTARITDTLEYDLVGEKKEG